jgi:hypothetical protein
VCNGQRGLHKGIWADLELLWLEFGIVSNALLLIGQCLLAMPKKKIATKLSLANTRANTRADTRALYPISKNLNLRPISPQDQKDAIFNQCFGFWASIWLFWKCTNNNCDKTITKVIVQFITKLDAKHYYYTQPNHGKRFTK